jgi:acetolactate synthase I/II/III large subunit
MRLQPILTRAAQTGVAERTRVVIVEDDPQQLRALTRILHKHRESVDASLFDNGRAALLEAELTKPQLIVMDVFMPGLDGVEVCRRLKANPATGATRVVLTSGRMTSDVRAAALAAGAEHVIDKPFDLSVLLEQLNHSELAAGSQPLTIVDERGAAPGAAARAESIAGAPVAGPEFGVEPRPTPPARARELRRSTAPPSRRAANVLVDMLVDSGVDVAFGLPGGAISPIHDALLDSEVRVVTTRHESGAMFAAAGYAHVTGKLGVAIVTSGPGALNSLTGLASAMCDGLPVLLLVGEVPRKAQGRGVLQDGSAHGLKIVEMAAHISKLALEVPDASQLPHLVRRAISTAMAGRRGPVVLTLPMDVTSALIAPPRIESESTAGGTIARAIVDEIAELLHDAERPLILAGSGVRGRGAPRLLRRVAERLQCPVVTTPKGKGVMAESHPLSLGVLGLGGHLSSRAYLESGVDAVLVLGSSLGDLSTDGFNPALQAATLIHVDIDGRQIGKSYAPTHAVVAGVAEFLDALDSRIAVGGGATRRGTVAGVVRHALAPSADDAWRIGPHEVLREMQQLLPADTIYTVDSGEHFTFATHYLKIDHPDSYLVMTGLGSMGQSIGAAIGAKLALPHRTVAAIVGDGCFAMNAFEVATAVAQRLPIRVFVFNDDRLGMVENGHEHVYGRRPDYSNGGMDVCAIAAGLGAATLRVCRPGDLANAARMLNGYPGPVVVDVQIDPAVRLPKKDRMAAFAPPPKVNADEPGVN